MQKQFNFEEFIQPYLEYVPRTDSRWTFYKFATQYLINLNRPILIIETGALWTIQGGFSLVFGDLIQNWTGGKLITIDISEDHLEKAKQNTKQFKSVIEYVLSDSIEYLKRLKPEIKCSIDLLYLDSYDLSLVDPLPSGIHHLQELLSVYDNLPNHTIIGVDDNLMPGHWMQWITSDSIQVVTATDNIIGKGTLTDRFLLDKGWKRFNDEFAYALLAYKKF